MDWTQILEKVRPNGSLQPICVGIRLVSSRQKLGACSLDLLERQLNGTGLLLWRIHVYWRGSLGSNDEAANLRFLLAVYGMRFFPLRNS